MPYVSEEVQLPYTDVEIGTGEKIEETDLVEFRLAFSGALPSTGNASNVSAVHAIRCAFHPQLRKLWTGEQNLRMLAKMKCNPGDAEASGLSLPLSENDMFNYGIKTIGTKWNKAGFDWIPLVTEDMVLRCSLDILLLRPEEGGKKTIIHRGDLDGQLKTLHDALSMPRHAEQIPKGASKNDGPFFVLLEDDSLITEIRVTTDRLLLLPDKTTVEPADCLAVVLVKLNHRSARTFDNYFG